MTKTLTITYEKSNKSIPVMCVAECNSHSTTVKKMFTGERAEQLYKELTGQNVVVKTESENRDKIIHLMNCGALLGVDTGRLDGECEDVIPLEDAIDIIDTVYGESESKK